MANINVLCVAVLRSGTGLDTKNLRNIAHIVELEWRTPMRLIDADVLYDIVSDNACHDTISVSDVLEFIKEAPTMDTDSYLRTASHEDLAKYVHHLEKIADAVIRFRDKYNIFCSESLWQMDKPLIDAPCLVDELIKLVGYKEY